MPNDSRAIVRLAASILATIGLAVVSVIWSENWFYGSWRAQDSVLHFAQTVVGYAAVVQVARYVAFRWRVAASGPGAWRRIFLVGALFGWMIEGVVVSTVVNVLPLSLSYTGLAWHALFTVLLGWWLVPRLLAGSLARSLLPLAAIGAGIGIWASFWRLDHDLHVSVPDFALYVTATTLAYAAGLAIWWLFRGRANPGLRGSALAMVVLAVLAALHAISNPLTLLGPVLVGLALFAIIHSAPPSAQADAPLLPTAGPTPWRSLWRLVLIPAVAIIPFWLNSSAGFAIVVGWIIVIATACIGAVLFVVAWVRAARRAELSKRLPSAATPGD